MRIFHARAEGDARALNYARRGRVSVRCRTLADRRRPPDVTDARPRLRYVCRRTDRLDRPV